MKTAIVIPARYASGRYPGKPLAILRGKDGAKTLIRRTWETGMMVPDIVRCAVATDDDRIAREVESFGGDVIMTSEAARNGTERCAETLTALGDVDLVINLQGDAPLTPSWFLTDLARAMEARADVGVATPVLKTDAETYGRFREDRAAGRVGGTTAVFTTDGRALYFSKEVIPFLPEERPEDPPVWHHVGVYAYRPDALSRYMTWEPGRLELTEGLEQLRFLENGEDILCVEVDAKGRQFWELNNPVDIERIESVL